jgi:hypothetical protein
LAFSAIGSLARLGLARAYAIQGDTANPSSSLRWPKEG